MGWLDGSDYTIKEKTVDEYRLSKDGITAKKGFIVSGPPLDPLDPVIGDNLLDVAKAEGLPRIGDEYQANATSPICYDITIAEIENSDSEKCRLYSVNCEYKLLLEGDSLPLLEWNSTEENYELASTAERYYFEPQQETVHIDSSKDFESYGDGNETPMIGVDEAGNVSGVDIQNFSSVLVVERFFNLSAVDFGKIQDSLGKTNAASGLPDSSFYGREEGECLFIGVQELGRSLPVSIATETEEIVKLQFRFLVSKNLLAAGLPTFTKKDDTTFTVTNGKKGWQYLWAKNGTKGDPANSNTKTYTELVQVHDVYESVNLASELGLSGEA